MLADAPSGQVLLDQAEVGVSSVEFAERTATCQPCSVKVLTALPNGAALRDSLRITSAFRLEACPTSPPALPVVLGFGNYGMS
jgi:hypothetical protein